MKALVLFVVTVVLLLAGIALAYDPPERLWYKHVRLLPGKKR